MFYNHFFEAPKLKTVINGIRRNSKVKVSLPFDGNFSIDNKRAYAKGT